MHFPLCFRKKAARSDFYQNTGIGGGSGIHDFQNSTNTSQNRARDPTRFSKGISPMTFSLSWKSGSGGSRGNLCWGFSDPPVKNPGNLDSARFWIWRCKLSAFVMTYPQENVIFGSSGFRSIFCYRNRRSERLAFRNGKKQ